MQHGFRRHRKRINLALVRSFLHTVGILGRLDPLDQVGVEPWPFPILDSLPPPGADIDIVGVCSLGIVFSVLVVDILGVLFPVLGQLYSVQQVRPQRRGFCERSSPRCCLSYLCFLVREVAPF